MSDDSAVDSTIDLKKRARRRLVGAAALALLAVIVLPIVMDSEPKPSGQDIQIKIPNKDNDPLVARVMPSHPAPLLQRDEISKSMPVVASVEPTTSTAADPAGKSATSSDIAPAVVAKAKTEPQTTKNDVAKKAEAAHAEAVLEGQDSAQWVVQLGAYQNAVNVKQLTIRLKDMGLPSYTEKIDSPQGARIRVRAGPFKSREVADKARLRIKKIGVDGPVAQK